MGILDFFGFGNKSKLIQEYISKGAVIIDVRSPGEFAGEDIEGSKNIPLGEISNKINEIIKLKNQLLLVVPAELEARKQLPF